MNAICGEEMAEQKIGIFRQATLTKCELQDDTSITDNLSIATKRVITMWNNVSGQYVLYNENIHHDIMKLSNYTHVTSPIRRLVDLLNQMLLCKSKNLINTFSQDAQEFIEKWLEQLPYINTSMRSIRKIQTDCELLHRCISNPNLLDIQHIGTLFDKIQKNDGGFVYKVYLEGLNLLTRLKSYTDYENYTSHNFQLFLFMDEHSLKKKIRVQLLC
jgi:exoribonuclease R